MKTVKIRISLAMNADGTDWSAQGWATKAESFKFAKSYDERTMDSCLESLEDLPTNPICRFIEVEVPIPEELPALQGTLVPEDNS